MSRRLDRTGHAGQFGEGLGVAGAAAVAVAGFDRTGRDGFLSESVGLSLTGLDVLSISTCLRLYFCMTSKAILYLFLYVLPNLHLRYLLPQTGRWERAKRKSRGTHVRCNAMHVSELINTE